MPRIRVVKPVCATCGDARFVACYLGVWYCFRLHADQAEATPVGEIRR